MHRLAFLALVAACGSSPRPAVTNATPTGSHHALQPLRLHGGEGRHSASQSWTRVGGALELTSSKATLTLDFQTDVSFIHCPKAWQDGTVVTMQACAPDDAKDSSTNSSLVLTGEARWLGGRLVVDLRHGEQLLALRCDETYLGLACSVDDDRTIFGFVGGRPSRLVFASPLTRSYELQPMSSNHQKVEGSLALDANAGATLRLRTAGKTVEIAASLVWTPAGLVISGGPATSNISLVCSDRGKSLACDVTADRSVLGQPDHLYGPAVFVAKL